MWIPIDAGDMSLNILYSRLETFLKQELIGVSTRSIPDHPLSSTINILVAHGGKTIAESKIISTGRERILNGHQFLGEGRVAILFVCHSGGMEKATLDQKVMSFVRELLERGYAAVVAPYWSLHISVPPIWLPAFLAAMRRGSRIADAVMAANQTVFNANHNPGAWACLHLYGDPYLKMAGAQQSTS
jgi:hypothetical protein